MDWIYNATARCKWWRVSAAGLRLRAVGRERERRAAGRLGLEEVWGEGAVRFPTFNKVKIPVFTMLVPGSISSIHS